MVKTSHPATADGKTQLPSPALQQIIGPGGKKMILISRAVSPRISQVCTAPTQSTQQAIIVTQSTQHNPTITQGTVPVTFVTPSTQAAVSQSTPPNTNITPGMLKVASVSLSNLTSTPTTTQTTTTVTDTSLTMATGESIIEKNQKSEYSQIAAK